MMLCLNGVLDTLIALPTCGYILYVTRSVYMYVLTVITVIFPLIYFTAGNVNQNVIVIVMCSKQILSIN